MPKKCLDCQSILTAKPDTTDKKFWCATCRDRHAAESKRYFMAEERAAQLFPEMGDSSASTETMLAGFRIDLNMMLEVQERYVVGCVYDKNNISWIWVFDAEDETIAKKQVEPNPKAKCYFDLEVAAANACVAELNPKGQ